MQIILKCQYFFKFFLFSVFLSFVHYYYMLVYLKWYILFKIFLYLFFISYLLYITIIYYKFKNDTYFLKIFLCKLSCNLYNGLFSGVTAIKKFWNYLHYVIFVTLHKQGLSFILPFYVVFNTVYMWYLILYNVVNTAISCSYCKYTLH